MCSNELKDYSGLQMCGGARHHQKPFLSVALLKPILGNQGDISHGPPMFLWRPSRCIPKAAQRHQNLRVTRSNQRSPERCLHATPRKG